jgi:hypothetical protein
MTDSYDEVDSSAPVNSGDENVDELLLRTLHAQGYAEIWVCGVVPARVAALVSWSEPAHNVHRVVAAGHNIVVARASRAGVSIDRGNSSSNEVPGGGAANRSADRPVVAVVLSAAAINAVGDSARLANLIDQGALHRVSVVLSGDSSVLDATMNRRDQAGCVQVGLASALEWAQARLARNSHRPRVRPPSSYPGVLVHTPVRRPDVVQDLLRSGPAPFQKHDQPKLIHTK